MDRFLEVMLLHGVTCINLLVLVQVNTDSLMFGLKFMYMFLDYL